MAQKIVFSAHLEISKEWRDLRIIQGETCLWLAAGRCKCEDLLRYRWIKGRFSDRFAAISELICKVALALVCVRRPCTHRPPRTRPTRRKAKNTKWRPYDHYLLIRLLLSSVDEVKSAAIFNVNNVQDVSAAVLPRDDG